MKLVGKMMFVFVVAIATAASAANTWYVDDDNYKSEYADVAAYIAAGLD